MPVEMFNDQRPSRYGVQVKVPVSALSSLRAKVKLAKLQDDQSQVYVRAVVDSRLNSYRESIGFVSSADLRKAERIDVDAVVPFEGKLFQLWFSEQEYDILRLAAGRESNEAYLDSVVSADLGSTYLSSQVKKTLAGYKISGRASGAGASRLAWSDNLGTSSSTGEFKGAKSIQSPFTPGAI